MDSGSSMAPQKREKLRHAQAGLARSVRAGQGRTSQTPASHRILSLADNKPNPTQPNRHTFALNNNDAMQCITC